MLSDLEFNYYKVLNDKLDYRIQKRDDAETSQINVKDFLPCNILRGEGIKIYFSYTLQDVLDEKYDIYVRTNSHIVFEAQSCKYIESKTISLCKLIERKGCKVKIPFCKEIDFCDMVYNYPIFACRTLENANLVISAINEMCKKWHENGDNRIITFTVEVPYENRTGIFRFLGHVDDFTDYYANGFQFIPNESNVKGWLLKSYDYLGKNFSSIKSNVHPFDIINKSGNLSIKRNFVSPEKIESWSKDGLVTLHLSEEEKAIIIKHGITAVVAFMDEKVRCSKCGKDYRNCNCISLIDENVVEVIEKGKQIGATWTNRSAFI